MIVFWRIRYFDSKDRQFKDRDLYLDTSTLAPHTRAAIEFVVEARSPGSAGREILKHRDLFTEKQADLSHSNFRCWFIIDYFEDENGHELTWKRMGEVVTGDPNAALFPSHCRKHDVELALAEKAPIDLASVKLSQNEVDALAYFSRDLAELLATEFFKNGPGTLWSRGGPVVFRTATTPDEICSFVTIFRRLYMQKEPGHFLRAAGIFSTVVHHPIADWVRGERDEYERELNQVPDETPFGRSVKLTFTRKNLIDAFLNTRFAHQPQNRRIRQYKAYLAEAGNEELLTFLFCTTVFCTALHYVNAGQHIRELYRLYRELHNVSPSFQGPSVADAQGVGVLEKRESRRKRILREKCDQLAAELWEQAGRPESGPARFLKEAETQIKAALG